MIYYKLAYYFIYFIKFHVTQINFLELIGELGLIIEWKQMEVSIISKKAG